MSAIAEIQAAKDARPALEAEREKLWEQLHANLAEREPLRAKEREIRAKLKTVQGQMFDIDQLLGEARRAAK